MKRSLWVRGIIFLLAIVGGLLFLYPTLRLWIDPNIEEMNEKERSDLERRSLHLGLDLVGGMHLMLEADTADQQIPGGDVEKATRHALKIIRNRIDQFGVSEPNIQRVGDKRIQIQLPGVADRERALDLVGRTGNLEFRLVADSAQTQNVLLGVDRFLSGDTLAVNRPFTQYLKGMPGGGIAVLSDDYNTVKNLVAASHDSMASDVDVLFGPEESYTDRNTNRTFSIRRVYVIKTKAELTGDDIDGKEVSYTQYRGNDPQYAGTWQVYMGLKRKAQTSFAQLTGNNVGRQLAIVLDDAVESAPVIKERIPPGSKPTIHTNDRSPRGQEAEDLANIIQNGALPVPMKVVEERTVSPTLGRDSIRAGIIAILVGLAAVVLFMIIYYSGAGLVSIAALVFNLFGLMAVLAGIGATISLPSLAGIALTIGMAVDANVLIYERIRDELQAGKFARSAVDTGYSKAWRIIIDANITTIIAAIILAIVNPGPVRGFAITLIFGLIINMITAVYLAKGLFDLYLFRRPDRKLFI